MASPTELILTPINVSIDGGAVVYLHGILEGFIVNSNTEVDFRVINNLKIRRSMVMQIINTDASNGLVVQIYGCAERVVVVPPEIAPDFSTGKYTLLTGSTTTIPAQSSEAFTISDSWRWVLIRVKRETAEQDATMNFYIHGE